MNAPAEIKLQEEKSAVQVEESDEDESTFNAGANVGMVIGSTVRSAGSAAVDASVAVGKAVGATAVAVGTAAVDAGTVVGKAAVSAVRKASMLTAGAVAGTLVGLFRGSKKDKDGKA